MVNRSQLHILGVGVGVASLVLSAVALLLFILPVLSIPIAIAGLFFGLIGVVISLFGCWSGFRWSLAGIALSLLTLALGIAIYQTANGYLSNISPAPTERRISSRPYIPPPAKPKFFR